MAKFTFTQVELKNFMSYEYANIRLDIPGYILINGRNNNEVDASYSNGSGKSTLFSAISWCLTGQTISGSKNVSNIYIENCKTEVELEVVVENDTYIIRRTKNPSNLFISINGVDKSGKGIRDTSELLSEYLPDLTPELLNSVIILGQGLPQRFTNNSPSGRKEVLETLSKSDFMIEDLKTRLQNRKSALDDELSEYTKDNIANESKLEIYDDMISNLLPLREEGYKVNVQSKYAMYNELVDSLSKNVVDNESILSSKENELAKINDKMLDLSKQQEDEINALPLEDTKELEKEIYDLDVNIQSLQTKINQAKNIVDVCPTCGQKLVGVEKIDTSEMESNLSELISNKVTKQEEINTISLKSTDAIEEVRDKYEKLSSNLLEDKNNLLEDINEIKEITKDLNRQLEKDKEKLQESVTALNDYRTKLEELNRLEDTVKDINQKILYNNNEVDILKNHLDINSKMNTLIKREFRGYLLTDIINYIDNKAKEYCEDVFNHTKIDFVLNGNNIDIVFDGREYELLSGGEKQKIDVIIQFSLRDMLCKYLRFSSNILVLDEITDSLDIVGAQQIFNLISNKLNDVQSIYIISHHTNDFEIPCDYEINIEKGSDKISRIV